MFARTTAWLRRLFSRSTTPTEGEIGATDKTRRELAERRERILYEAIELDDEIQRVFRRWKETDSDLLKKELLRTLTIKRAEYESLEARLSKIGEAELSMTRRSAFLQSFLDLPEVTEADLERLESLQGERQVRERRAVLYTDRVIGLTEMRPESSIKAQELEQRTVEKLEREAKAREEKEARQRLESEGEAPATARRSDAERLAEAERRLAEGAEVAIEEGLDAAEAEAPRRERPDRMMEEEV